MLGNAESKHLFFKSLDHQVDDLSNYLAWMQNKSSNPFISGVNPLMNEKTLQEFIVGKNASSEALLLGIFLKENMSHIGNIKLEPIVIGDHAWLGILIGEVSARGKSLGFETMSTVCRFAFKQYFLKEILLATHPNNLKAISLYHRVGFAEITTLPSNKDRVTMKLSRAALT